MRTVLISLAATVSALVVATPAAAQYHPQPQGQAYGYNNYGQVRSLQVRIDAIQRQIVHLDRRNILSDREARRLSQDARELERRLRFARRDGLHRGERIDIERRLARLEQRLWRDARDGNRWGSGHRSGSNDYDRDHDRDRDGRDDRHEDDHGSRHD